MFSALLADRCPADGSTTAFSPPFSPLPLSADAASLSKDDISLDTDNDDTDVIMRAEAAADIQLPDLSDTQMKLDTSTSRFTDAWVSGLMFVNWEMSSVCSKNSRP